MKEEIESKNLSYRNALEPLVETEVRSQIEKFSSQRVEYLRPEEAIAFALNRLPPLYATTAEGWDEQQYRAIAQYDSHIKTAARWGIEVVQRNPYRMGTPLENRCQVS
ncbi:late competence development ComFB family protein [Oscillatoria sp. FACHB-1406]|uniref:late competence development ComFB family protein n=1 Tax=Oscillatoria sp. FACHB-1406 TaxID=2692846 RepID=UPI0016841126|nr:late competence development ComFB family protein [Oscillatoria sp. FACHB-1406]MBD2576771.1 late competence development ComFB family protein [Oscillatoria sp. FACHB-1406]